MVNKCKVCDLEKKIGESEYCVLHCEKNDYKADLDSGLLKEFHIALVKYCRFMLLPHCTDIAVQEEIENFLKSTAINKNNTYTSENSKRKISSKITFDRIKFPERIKGDSNDFLPIFRSFQIIHFSGCHFNLSVIDDCCNTQFFFESCHFLNDWQITPINIADSMLGFLYQTCTFHKSVMNDNPQLQIKGRAEINGNLFYLCDFRGNIVIHGVEFNGLLFSEQSTTKNVINMIKLDNCILKDKFYLNRFKILQFESKNTIFEHKFEFKHNVVDIFEINNSNFNGLVDCFESKFKRFNVEKSIFKEFVGFEHCKFGLETDKKNKDLISVFRYATFLKFINFRKTRFFNGLDIENINLLQPPNFLGSCIYPKNTNRETFRIVKHSFDATGNYLEANKYFKEEMEKYRKELKISKFFEWVIFWFNKLTSNYGQNYLLPIGWILFVMYLHSLVISNYEENILYKYEFVKKFNLEEKILWLNSYAKSLTPMKNFLNDGFEFLSLLFYIAYVVLIYQTVVALKRLTKR